MTISLPDFISQLGSNPALLITVILTLGVILVNGWTDAPNAIATCVSTRALKPKPAILMAAVFNFLGVLLMTMVNATVAYTIYSMVDFGGNSHEALVALCAAMVAIVTWATVAWRFGIPHQRKPCAHCRLSGAAIAMHGGLGGINGAEWVSVLYGLALPPALGLTGLGIRKITAFAARILTAAKPQKFFHYGQIGGAAAMSFMHGAQDGKKFMGVFLLVSFLPKGRPM